MLYFSVVFDVLFINATDILQISNLLALRQSNKELYAYLSNEQLTESMRKLIQKIRKEYCKHDTSEIKMSLVDMQSFLITVHRLGKQLEFLKRKYASKCIVAGSFALAFFTLLQDGYMLFEPNDIDVYYDREYNIRKQLKELIELKWRYICFDTSNTYSSNKVGRRNVEHIITRLNTSEKFKKYDWKEILQSMKNASRVSYIDEIYIVDRGNYKPFNLISTWIKYECTNTYSSTILSQFDMLQCCIAITDMHGSFYPSFYIESNVAQCIEKRSIEFNDSGAFFGKLKKQLNRISKYQERGFGLQTNPSNIIRLSE
tara:strand:- start:18136 stop:19080 length:945 start_codon:yes stop_codon:yes gene_type:complete